MPSATLEAPAQSPTSAPPTVTSTASGPVICVFCGASEGGSPAHLAAARALGRALSEANATLVYGAGVTGIMGEVAKTFISLSGHESIIGIIPEPLLRVEQKTNSDTDSKRPPSPEDIFKQQIQERTIVVGSMHERKALMAKRVAAGGPGSGFVAISGGFGTIEELMEMTTWNQLGIHNKGVVIFNVEGYWDGLLEWVRTAVSEQFIAPENAGIMKVALAAEEVITALKEYKVSPKVLNLGWTQS